MSFDVIGIEVEVVAEAPCALGFPLAEREGDIGEAALR